MEIKKVWSVNCLWCWKTKWRRLPPLGWGIEICWCSSCVWGLRSLLNTEGILTLPMFLLSDGSLIWMWSASFPQWCMVLLSLSIILKSLSSAFGFFVEMWWFLMALVIWFLLFIIITDFHMNSHTFIKDSYNHKTLLESRKLEKLEIQLANSRTARIFNLRCLANKVTPKNLQIKWKGNKFEQATCRKAEHSLIHNRTKCTNIKINHLQTEIANTKLSLQQKLDEPTFTDL